MGFKQVLFLGGAVLVLAGCGDATAPSQMKRGGSSADTKTAVTPAPTDPAVTATSADEDCRSSYWVSSGRDSTCVSELQ